MIYFFCRFLHLMGIPNDRLDNVMTALNHDAQANTILSRRMVKLLAPTRYTADLKNRCDQYCRALNLPRLKWP